MAHGVKIIRNLAYPAIDGIRFYAALVVFLEHTIGMAVTAYFGVSAQNFTYHSTNTHLRILVYIADGNHGVDVFFIISGFLMARIVLADRRRFTYFGFIGKRFLRIYPAFVVSLIVTTLGDVLVFGWAWKPVDFVKDLVFANAVPAWGVLPYNNVSWSLGYEFAFYLIIPVLVILARFMNRQVAAGLMFASAILLIPDTFARMLGLFAGAVIGSMNDDRLTRIARATPLTLAAVFYVGCAVLKAVWFQTFFPYYYSFLAAASLLFVKIVWDERTVLNRLFRTGLLRTLGTLSFSIYLYHSIIAALVQTYLTPYPPSHAGAIRFEILTALITLGVAYASYMLIERPYFARKRPQAATEAVA